MPNGEYTPLHYTLEQLALIVLADGGPTRVLVDRGQRATTPKIAKEKFGITPDIIFLRDDGWSLGASFLLAIRAEDLWKDQWVGVMIRGRNAPAPYHVWRDRWDNPKPYEAFMGDYAWE